MTTLPANVFVVASFSGDAFRGNPAGVCILDAEHACSDTRLQAMAAELNQPETAFVWRAGAGWRIRWFSRLTEVELCGHATLAAAHVLWRYGMENGDVIGFMHASGLLGARREAEMVWLDFPAIPGAHEAAPTGVLSCINATPTASARHADRWLLEFEHADQVRSLRVDYGKLRATGIRSLVVTARSDQDDFDIVSRNFAPIVGVDEDQVTGAAHCCLGPYWRENLGAELRCWQASQRGGKLIVITKSERVALGGQALVEIEGRWSV